MKLNEAQRFVKNFIFKIISWLITGVISIMIVARLSSALQPEGFGKYNFLLTYVTYFLFLTSLGTDIIAIRIITVEKDRIKTILGALISLKLIMTAVIFIIMLIPVFFVPKLHGLGWLLVIFGTMILPFPFSVQCAFEATKRMEFPSIISIVSQVLNLILVMTLVRTPDDLLAAGLILTAVNVFIFALHNIIFFKYYGLWKPVIDLALWKTLLKDGIIIGFIQIVNTMIHFFNITLLGFMKTDHEVGIFSAAYRVIFMILSIIAILYNLITPIFFEYYKLNLEKFKDYFSHYLKFMIFLSMFTAVMAFFLAQPVLNIFYDLDIYQGSIACFQILTGSVLLLGLNAPYDIGLIAMHREKIVLGIMLVMFTMNITLNILLIPVYGIQGSSVATVISQSAGFPLFLFFFRKHIKIPVIKNYIRAFVSIIPVVLVMHFISVHFILQAIIGAVVMVASAVIVGGYTPAEIRFILGNIFKMKSGTDT
jgi:O-antigen/teichoic acid export membrane protein